MVSHRHFDFKTRFGETEKHAASFHSWTTKKHLRLIRFHCHKFSSMGTWINSIRLPFLDICLWQFVKGGLGTKVSERPLGCSVLVMTTRARGSHGITASTGRSSK